MEVLFDGPFPPGRARLNCTAPAEGGRWHWFGASVRRATIACANGGGRRLDQMGCSLLPGPINAVHWRLFSQALSKSPSRFWRMIVRMLST